jgi:hypothetical protein
LCPCRAVWRDHVEKKLSSQVLKVRKQVREIPPRPKRTSSSKSKPRDGQSSLMR